MNISYPDVLLVCDWAHRTLPSDAIGANCVVLRYDDSVPR